MHNLNPLTMTVTVLSSYLLEEQLMIVNDISVAMPSAVFSYYKRSVPTQLSVNAVLQHPKTGDRMTEN